MSTPPLAAVLARTQASLQGQSSREAQLLHESISGELAALDKRLNAAKGSDAYLRLVRQRARLHAALAPLVAPRKS